MKLSDITQSLEDRAKTLRTEIDDRRIELAQVEKAIAALTGAVSYRPRGKTKAAVLWIATATEFTIADIAVELGMTKNDAAAICSKLKRGGYIAAKTLEGGSRMTTYEKTATFEAVLRANQN